MANEKDSRCPSVVLGHDDILTKSCSGKRRRRYVDCNIFGLVFVEFRRWLLPKKCPSKLVDKKSKSERKFLLGQPLNVHTCQMTT
jgi:hypothetical protein